MADDPTTPGDPAPSTEPATVTTAVTTDLGDAGKRALDEERQARREAEKARKTLEKELAELRQQSMSDTEKAIEQARIEARTQVLAEFGGKVAAAEVRAAAAGRLEAEQVETLLDGLNLSRFVKDDGDVDRDAVTKFVDGIAPKPQQGPRGALDQGARSTTPLNGDALTNALAAAVGANRPSRP